MDLNTLVQLITQGEGPRIEFKESFPKNATEVAQIMAAFANTEGGTILIGVTDDARIVGVPDPDQTMQRIVGVAQNICKPPVAHAMGRILVDHDRFVIWTKVERQRDIVYLVDGRCYLRVGPTAQAVTDSQQLAQLLRRSTVPAERLQPARSLGPSLPPISKGFQGRAAELASLLPHLQSDTVSLVAIEGISGIGKTALAARFASLVADRHYKAFWVDCRRETTLDLITFRLAEFARAQGDADLADLLDATDQVRDGQTRYLATVLSGRSYALFLDDYHVLLDQRVDDLLAEIESRSELTKVFVTTRQRPGLLDRVSPLGTAELRLHSGLDQASCASFLQDCKLDLNRSTSDAIWRLTGKGHPKALQIFASRAKSIPVRYLLSNLPIFHETLTNAWLQPLLNELSEEQRDIILHLSVFDRPIHTNALDRLFPERNPLLLVLDLIDRFILEYIRREFLEMHPLLRDFCYSLLEDKVEKHSWAASFYLGKCVPSGDRGVMDGPQIESYFAAWYHATKAGNHAKASEIVSILRAPLSNRGHHDQVMLLLNSTIPATQEDENFFTIYRARILSVWGSADRAVELVSPITGSENPRVAREAILVLAGIYNHQSRPEHAIEILEKYWHRFSGPVPSGVKIHFIQILVQAYLLKGNSEDALRWASQICEMCDAAGDKLAGAIALRQMAIALRAQGNPESGLPLCRLSVEMLEDLGRGNEAAISRMIMGSLCRDLEDDAGALECFEEALKVFVASGARKDSTFCRGEIQELQVTKSA